MFEGGWNPGGEHGLSWNSARTDPVWAVRERPAPSPAGCNAGRARCDWGLVPLWAKDPGVGSRVVNGHGETAHEKPVYAGPSRLAGACPAAPLPD
ncbi:SOS response-associated peptidase family protein [Streptomyces aureus]|uniref:SOS response-associated peptidase family protein n=1 Tax=Streptomyces aureus TaxID=193461 RepID=UPI000AFE0214|nr:SOS response-associated peptidase family protein [Streptomyces aureus]